MARKFSDLGGTGVADEEVGEKQVVVGLPKRIRFSLASKTPLIMHRDDVDWADYLKAYRAKPQAEREKEGDEAQVKGDDRDPAWAWIGNTYHDGEQVVIPSFCMQAALIYAATKMPKGSRGSYKADAAALVMLEDPNLILETNGKSIDWSDVEELRRESSFENQKKLAAKLGIFLDVRRVTIGRNKHVRVRPRFEKWSASGTLLLSPGAITVGKLREIMENSGRYAGLCEWRPSSPKKPGPFGTFVVDSWELLA